MYVHLKMRYTPAKHLLSLMAEEYFERGVMVTAFPKW
jgi:hypothetical protein